MKDPRLGTTLQLGRDSKRIDCVPMTGLVPWNWAPGYIAGFSLHVWLSYLHVSHLTSLFQLQTVRAGQGKKFCLLQRIQTGSWRLIQPTIQWVTEAKRPGLEADHSSPFSSKVKNGRNYTFIPLYSFVAYALAILTSPIRLPRLNLLFAYEFCAVFFSSKWSVPALNLSALL
jgi:hypothetical protein